MKGIYEIMKKNEKQTVKKWSRVFLCQLLAALICLLTACGGTSTDQNGTTVSGTQNKADGFALTVAGVEIVPGMILPAMPEADAVYSAASCAIEGLDKTYTYGSIVISTQDDGKTERVTGLTIMDDGAATGEGITIGDSAERVKAVYGEPASQSENVWRYLRGKTALRMLFREGMVTSIVYETAE